MFKTSVRVAGFYTSENFWNVRMDCGLSVATAGEQSCIQKPRAMPSLPHRINVRLTGASNTVMESHTAMRHVHIFYYSSRQHSSRSDFAHLITLFVAINDFRPASSNIYTLDRISIPETKVTKGILVSDNIRVLLNTCSVGKHVE
jgi:hypothetical protein